MTLRFIILLIFIACCLTFPQSSGAQSSDVFLPRPIFNQPGLSTDGKRVVVTDIRKVPTTQLLVLDLSGGDAPVPIDTGNLDPIFARWVGDNRLMIYAVRRSNYKIVSVEETDSTQDRFIGGRFKSHLIFIDSDGSNRIDVPREKIDPRQDGLSVGDFSLGTVGQGYVGLYVGEGQTHQLLQINIQDGSVKVAGRGKDNVMTMRLADKDTIGLSLQRNPKSGDLSILTLGGKVKFSYEEFLGIDFQGYSHDGQSLYFSYRKDGRDKAALYKIGPKRKVQGPLAEHGRFDLYATHDTRDGRVLGAIFSGGPFEHVMFEPADQKHMRGLKTFFGKDMNIRVVDASADKSVWMVYVRGPKEPGAYFIYDKKSGSVDHLLDRFAPVAPQSYSDVKVFDYTARDGQPLFGYLTTPAGASSQTPLLVLPHGGPHSNDNYGFSYSAQHFAAQGYRVFQPQFRGSTGQGWAFEAAGFMQWGGRMQDDVTDGVKALMESGQAQKGRIAIAGFSYGGYAALWGALQQDDLYKTAIAVNPVSDITDQIEWFHQSYSRYKGYEEQLYSEWGNPEKDAVYLQNRSPINFIDQLNIPLLLIHGTNDGVVPIRQSRALVEKAKAANISLTYKEVKSAGHSLETDVGEYTLQGDQVDYLKEMKATMKVMSDHLNDVFGR